jgi:hypothetical protein
VSGDFLRKVDKTVRFHTRRALRVARGAWWSMARPPAVQPVFVVGCSRAGTTVVYKVLSEADELGSLSRETHDFWDARHPVAERRWSTHALGIRDASSVDRDHVTRYFFSQTGRHRWVDKNNQNGLCVPYLNALFPDAKFVFVTRHPGDNLASLIEGWSRPEEFATWSGQLEVRVNFEGRSLPWCFFLAEGWRAYVDRPLEEICAFQYRAMNEALLTAERTLAPERWTRLAYEDLLRAPHEATRQLFARLGLRYDSPAAERCKAALGQTYNAFSTIAVDKWRSSPHATRVARVLPELAPLAARLGYAIDP